MANRYINPDYGINGDGTTTAQAASPGTAGAYNTWSGIAWTAGNSYLQKRGTTYPGMVTVGITGTLGNRVTLGAYYNSDGSDDDTKPKPVINAGGATQALVSSAKGYITIQDLQLMGGLTYQMLFDGETGCQILRVTATDSTATSTALYIYDVDADFVFSGNDSSRSIDGGTVITFQNSTNITVTDNVSDDCSYAGAASSRGQGIWITTASGSTTCNGMYVAGNRTNRNAVSSTSTNAGVGLSIDHVANLICVDNTSDGNYLVGVRVGTADRVLIANNHTNSNGDFGIHVTAPSSGVTIRRNVCNFNGGGNSATGYGRGIEVYGPSDVSYCTGIAVVDNECNGNTMTAPITNGTEGVGIGMDGFTRNFVVARNRCDDNDGNGIQITGGGTSSIGLIQSNVCVNNFAVAHDTGTVLSAVPANHSIQSSINVAAAFVRITISDNYVASTHATHKFGITLNHANTDTTHSIRNNVVDGASVAAYCMRILYVADGVGSKTNVYKNSPLAAGASLDGGATLTTQTYSTSITVTTDQFDVNGRPALGAAVLSAGTHTTYTTDISGVQFWNPPSVGAYEYVRPREARV